MKKICWSQTNKQEKKRKFQFNFRDIEYIFNYKMWILCVLCVSGLNFVKETIFFFFADPNRKKNWEKSNQSKTFQKKNVLSFRHVLSFFFLWFWFSYSTFPGWLLLSLSFIVIDNKFFLFVCRQINEKKNDDENQKKVRPSNRFFFVLKWMSTNLVVANRIRIFVFQENFNVEKTKTKTKKNWSHTPTSTSPTT